MFTVLTGRKSDASSDNFYKAAKTGEFHFVRTFLRDRWHGRVPIRQTLFRGPIGRYSPVSLKDF